jgi:hypothetical protein
VRYGFDEEWGDIIIGIGDSGLRVRDKQGKGKKYHIIFGDR